MDPEDLTITNIDSMRHLVVGECVVKAIAYAVRGDSEDHTAYRFATALTVTGRLENEGCWPELLEKIKKLEGERVAK